jgi:membrane associated rhomboid family serine protease
MAITQFPTRRSVPRNMLFIFAIALIAITFVAMAGLYFALCRNISNSAATYAVIVSELVAISLIPAASVRMARRSKLKRTQRLAAYRASPESHFLHLND